jgi:hypothetical protein
MVVVREFFLSACGEGRLTGEQHLALVIGQVDVLGVSRFAVHGRLHHVVTCALAAEHTSQVIALSLFICAHLLYATRTARNLI